jgi:hypothetical protein
MVASAGLFLLAFGVVGAAHDRDPGLDGTLSAALLLTLLGGVVLVFPFLGSAVRNVVTDGRFPFLARGLVWPGVWALTVAFAIGFVGLFEPRGVVPYAVAGLGMALLVVSLALRDGP